MRRRGIVDLLAPALRCGPLARALDLAFRLRVAVAARGEPAAALRELLELDAGLQRRIDVLAIDLDGGVHAKHRLIGYHDFFVERVRAGERVLDVGCGKGELAHDLAVRAGAHVVGIDVSEVSLAFARERFAHERVSFERADVLAYEPGGRFDAIVLSNVLEHLAPRVELLRRLSASLAPEGRFLIRVPLYSRDWLVPLREELGLDSRGDPTHEVEYRPESFLAELHAARLEAGELRVDWGEIWAEVRPGSARGSGYPGAAGGSR